MAGRLNEFLERARLTPFAWGRFDCILFLADWSKEIGAGDPAASYRETYCSEFGAGRVIVEAGGLAALVGREFERLGWSKVDDPRPGDIGVVRAIGEPGEVCTGALRAVNFWVMVTMHGLLFANAPTLSVWRPPCRPF